MSRVLSFFLAALSVAAVFAGEETYVKIADDSNFDEVVDGSKNFLVAFVAPWCGHCQRLKPEYELAARELRSYSKVVELVQVDADANKKLASRFEVKSFPTIKYFESGSTEQKSYDGPRDADGILNWVNGKFGTNARLAKPPTAVKVLNSVNFDDIVMDPEKDVLVEFYAPWCGHCKKLAPVWEKAAQSLKLEPNCVVANLDATADSAIAEKYGVAGYPTIKFFPRGKSDKTPIDYTGGREEEDVINYLNEKCGTKRKSGGLLLDTAGRVDDLDAIAKEIAEKGVSEALTSKLEEASKGHSTGAYYVKAAKRIAERGVEFVDKEMARLQSTIDGGKIKLEKRDEFQYRLNILSAFKKAVRDEL